MVLESVLTPFFYMYLSSFPSTHWWWDCLYSIVHFCLLCHRLIDHRCMGLFLGFFPVPIQSVQFSHSVMSNSLWSHELQHARPPCPSLTPRVCLNSCPSSKWCHPPISSSAVPFFSCLRSFPPSESFPMSQFFTSGGQSIGASASVLPGNIQDWFPLGWIGWISLLSKGLSRVFSNTTVQKHQFFGT